MINTWTDKLSDFWLELKNEPAYIALGITILALAAILALLFQPVELVRVDGNVVGKEYTPSSTSIGVGSGVSANGQPVSVVTTSSKSEKWTVILDIKGKYVSLDVSPETFYSIQNNSFVSIVCHRGKWMHYIESCE